MKFLVQNVRPISVQLVCEKCNKGLLQFKYGNEVRTLSGPLEYQHICTNCGEKKWLNTIYPYIKQIGIENLREPTETEMEYIK